MFFFWSLYQSFTITDNGIEVQEDEYCMRKATVSRSSINYLLFRPKGSFSLAIMFLLSKLMCTICTLSVDLFFDLSVCTIKVRHCNDGVVSFQFWIANVPIQLSRKTIIIFLKFDLS